MDNHRDFYRNSGEELERFFRLCLLIVRILYYVLLIYSFLG
jgi:hypothetical protein